VALGDKCVLSMRQCEFFLLACVGSRGICPPPLTRRTGSTPDDVTSLTCRGW
jgi:hypothetical protein